MSLRTQFDSSWARGACTESSCERRNSLLSERLSHSRFCLGQSPDHVHAEEHSKAVAEGSLVSCHKICWVCVYGIDCVISWCCVFGILLDLLSHEQNTFFSSEWELKLTFLFGSQRNDVHDLNTWPLADMLSGEKASCTLSTHWYTGTETHWFLPLSKTILLMF